MSQPRDVIAISTQCDRCKSYWAFPSNQIGKVGKCRNCGKRVKLQPDLCPAEPDRWGLESSPKVPRTLDEIAEMIRLGKLTGEEKVFSPEATENKMVQVYQVEEFARVLREVAVAKASAVANKDKARSQQVERVKSEVKDVAFGSVSYLWNHPFDLLMILGFVGGFSISYLSIGAISVNVDWLIYVTSFMFTVGFFWRILSKMTVLKFPWVYAIGLSLVVCFTYGWFDTYTIKTVQKVDVGEIETHTIYAYLSGNPLSCEEKLYRLDDKGKRAPMSEMTASGPLSKSGERHGKWETYHLPTRISQTEWFYFGERLTNEAEFRRLEK